MHRAVALWLLALGHDDIQLIAVQAGQGPGLEGDLERPFPGPPDPPRRRADPARASGLPQGLARCWALGLFQEPDQVLADEPWRILAEQRCHVVVHEHDATRSVQHSQPDRRTCGHATVHIYEIACQLTEPRTRWYNRALSLPVHRAG